MSTPQPQHSPGNPAWLASQQQDRARAADNLGRAADQVNTCRAIAADLRTQGRMHQDDLTWQAAVRESHRLNEIAEADGFDEYAVADEAARRQGAQTTAGRVQVAIHCARTVLTDAATVPLDNPVAVADMIGRLQATVETLLTVIGDTKPTA